MSLIKKPHCELRNHGKAGVNSVRQRSWKGHPCVCTLLTYLGRAVCPVGCRTCHRSCAFFHPPGQVAPLQDSGDTAFRNPPRPGVNYKSEERWRRADVGLAGRPASGAPETAQCTADCHRLKHENPQRTCSLYESCRHHSPSISDLI